MKKRILLGLLIFLLLAYASFFVVYGIDGTHTFSEIVESGDLSNLRLTIYFLHSDFIEREISINDIKGGFYDYKITVKGSDLEKNMDSISELSKEPLIPYEQATYLFCRIYYVFTTKLGHKLYDVAMWSSGESLNVNGVAVKDTDIFYDVILPFLPQDAADELRFIEAELRQETLERNGQHP